MCTGRIDLSFSLRALLSGADGVFIGGCWPGECHYITEGNYDAVGNMHLLKKLMQHVGLDVRRLRLEWVAASEGTRFAEVMDDFTKTLNELGPLGESEGLDHDAMMADLEAVSRMVPQLKLLAREKLQVKVKSEAAYDALYASPKIDALLDAFLADPLSSAEVLPSYWIDPEKCKACLICSKECPVRGIAGEKKTVHVIDQEMCTQCGTCFHSCPPKLGAVQRIPAGQPIPAPIPEAERTIVRVPKARKAKTEVAG